MGGLDAIMRRLSDDSNEFFHFNAVLSLDLASFLCLPSRTYVRDTDLLQT